MNRLSGTAASMLGWLQGDLNDPRVMDKVERVAGEWVGGFTVPFRTFKDAMSIAGSEEERLYRDTREDPNQLMAATMSNLPFANRDLAPRVSVTTGEPMKNEAPVLSGVFGLNARTIDAVEEELTTLGLKPSDVAPKTGVPKADRALYRRVGKLTSLYGPQIVKSEAYQKLSPVEKRIYWQGDGTPKNPGFFGRMRKIAKEDLKASNPKLADAIKIHDSMTTNLRALYRERGIDVEQRLRDIADEAEED